MILDELLKLNPVRIFWESTQSLPGMKSNYHAILFLKNLDRYIQKKIVEPTEELESLNLDSKSAELCLEGIYNPRKYFWAKILRIKKIHYQARLKVVHVEDNIVRFKFTAYSLDNPGKKKWDFIRFFSRFDPIHKKRILNKIVRGFPNTLKLTPIKWEIQLNLNYFLNQVPSIAGKIHVITALPDNGNMYFSAKSSVIMKPLMDFFGPEYIKISYDGEV